MIKIILGIVVLILLHTLVMAKIYSALIDISYELQELNKNIKNKRS